MQMPSPAGHAATNSAPGLGSHMAQMPSLGTPGMLQMTPPPMPGGSLTVGPTYANPAQSAQLQMYGQLPTPPPHQPALQPQVAQPPMQPQVCSAGSIRDT